jgi:hypothetical protein
MSTKTSAPLQPTTQLEIAAQWLNEAAAATADRGLKVNLERVGRDCLRAAVQKVAG